MIQIAVPGQRSVLQSAVSVESPEQSAPPLLGAGFVQLLVLDFDPVPQVKLHVPYALQADHPPSTADTAMRNDFYINSHFCEGKN